MWEIAHSAFSPQMLKPQRGDPQNANAQALKYRNQWDGNFFYSILFIG